MSELQAMQNQIRALDGKVTTIGVDLVNNYYTKSEAERMVSQKVFGGYNSELADISTKVVGRITSNRDWLDNYSTTGLTNSTGIVSRVSPPTVIEMNRIEFDYSKTLRDNLALMTKNEFFMFEFKEQREILGVSLLSKLVGKVRFEHDGVFRYYVSDQAIDDFKLKYETKSASDMSEKILKGA